MRKPWGRGLGAEGCECWNECGVSGIVPEGSAYTRSRMWFLQAKCLTAVKLWIVQRHEYVRKRIAVDET